MQKTFFLPTSSLLLITLFVVITVALTTSQCYPLKIKKVGSLFQTLLPATSSTQDREYLSGFERLFITFWKFGENSLSPEPCSKEGMKLVKAHYCLLPHIIQHTHEIHSDCLQPTSCFHLNYYHTAMTVSLCNHNTQCSVSFQRALLKAQGVICPALRRALFFHKNPL